MTLFEVYMKKFKKYESEGRKEAKEDYDTKFIEEYDPVRPRAELQINEVYFDNDFGVCIDAIVTSKYDLIAQLSLEVDIPLSVLIDAIVAKIVEDEELKKKLLDKLIG
ncbi:MAG: hypothetical protein DRM98_00385 [Thermoplasmata archaeon]|nr:MAG: hypothetical protein DRM98_00385 [Thermoplasmata archaeon]